MMKMLINELIFYGGDNLTMFMLPMISKVCLAYNVTHVDVSLIMLLLKMTMTIISKVCLARPGRGRGKLQPSGLECFSGHWKIPI